MPFCPYGHGPKTGQHCDQCGAELADTPPAAGDSVRVRSPQAHAVANPTFVLPGGTVETRPALVRCPWCGQRKLEHDTFDCQGECGRQHLCLRHFDDEFDVCQLCARALRGEAKAEAERQARMETELVTWRQRAETAETQVAELTRQGLQTSKDMDQARADLDQAHERVRSLEQEVADLYSRAAQAEVAVAALTRRSQQAESNLTHEVAVLRETQTHMRQEFEMQRQQEDEAGRRRDAEARRLPPLWLQIGIELVRVPAGEFLYGSDKQKVYLSEYWIAKTPVTNAQYEAFVETTGYTAPDHWLSGHIPTGTGNHPVTYVNWDDARSFCHWVGLRLPKEQEWEKAARGVDGRSYPWGEYEPNEKRCNFKKHVRGTMPVDSHPAGASPYGLMDMAGNVTEFCEELWDGRGNRHVVRSFGWEVSNPLYMMVYTRRNWNPGLPFSNGFRCAYSL